MQNSMALFTFFCFRLEIQLLGKFSPKNQNCQFKLKLGTLNNSNMQNSMMVFNFSVLDRKHPFQATLVQKNQICHFKVKFGT